MTAPVAAQTGGGARWTDPTGAWSLDIASAGWGRTVGLPADGPVLLTLPATPPADGEVRMCIVEQAFEPLAQGADETEVRNRAAQMNVREAEAAFPRMSLSGTRVSHAVIDGEAVAVVEGMSRGNRFRGRIFVTYADRRAVVWTIACISDSTAPAARSVEIDAILASLRFEAGPASRSASPSWTDPSGRFSLTYSHLGWSGPPLSPTDDGYLLAVENPSLQANSAGPRVCAVRHAPPVRVETGAPQDRINALTTGLTERQLQVFHHTTAPIQNLTFMQIDGVAVVDYVTEANGAWQHWRTFWLLQGDQAFMYDVACTATPPVSADEVANMAAFLDSLHFLDPRASE
jgi:hypothetical protein